MAQKPNVSAHDTLSFLQEKLGTDISDLTLLSGGDWSQAYSFVHRQKKYVLRWCYSSETFEKDTLASAYRRETMPIPIITDSGIHDEIYFAISEFVQGQFIETLTPDELEKTLPALLNLFDALRATDLTGTSGYGGWDKNGVGSHKSWKDYLLDVKSDDEEDFAYGWYRDLANSSIGTHIFDQLYSQFDALVAFCPEGRELIHSDLLNSNLLVADAKISGVIDWQCSLYGDSLYDVAWLMFCTLWFPQFTAVQLNQKLMAHFESTTTNVSHLNERLLCYQLHIGLGSIRYNAFKKDWKLVQDVADYTLKISRLG
jgi:hygromycin-B 4-O-kinase